MNFIKRYFEIYKQIWSFSKLYVIMTYLISAYSLANTYLLLYLNKIVLNAVSDAVIQSNSNNQMVFYIIAIVCIVEIITTFLYNIIQYWVAKIKMKYDDKLTLELARSVSHLDMSYFDDMTQYNDTNLLFRYSSSMMMNFSNSVAMIFAIISFIISFNIIIRQNILIAIVAIISIIPGFIVRNKLKLYHFNMEKKLTRDNRFIDYLTGLFLSKPVKMEMQIYDFEDHLANKLEKKQTDRRKEKIRYSLKKATWEMILIVYDKLIYFINSCIMIIFVIKKSLTIGDFPYYSGIISNISSSLNSIVSLVNEIRIVDKQYLEFYKIQSREPKINDKGKLKIDKSAPFDIEFVNVSFKYPNSDYYALNNISFKFNSTQIIAFVGENGSGKSTIVKLLLRFYDPCDGYITLNGINIQEYEINEYRSLFSSMFQDVNLYLLPIEENIKISDVRSCADDRLKKIICSLGLEEINGMALDLNCYYGKEFDERGYVLSTGQQQKIHAARTLYRKTEIYLLDEPAASMDIITEKRFLNSLNQIIGGKGIIYITHRYNNLNNVDNIYLLEKGILLEEGSHLELLNEKGKYYEMYSLQNLKE